jgi:hypothetical protein
MMKAEIRKAILAAALAATMALPTANSLITSMTTLAADEVTAEEETTSVPTEEEQLPDMTEETSSAAEETTTDELPEETTSGEESETETTEETTEPATAETSTSRSEKEEFPDVTTEGPATTSEVITQVTMVPPFIADTDDNGAINIDESQIVIKAERYYPGGLRVPTDIIANTIVSSEEVDSLPIFTRAMVTFNITGEDLDFEAIKKTSLDVTYYYGGKENDEPAYKNPDVVRVSDNDYILSYDILTLGESFEFCTSPISGTDVSCISASITPQSNCTSYYQIKAETPDGEDVIICTRYPKELSEENMVAWAKRLCMLANSLSDMTKVRLGKLYICLDHPDTNGAFSGNWHINDDCDEFGMIGVCEDYSNSELELAASGKNEISWTLMHEMGHSYCIGSKPSDFNDNYGFFRFESGCYFDEYLTNVRALTAIQHCDNLRDTDVHFSNGSESFDNKFDRILKDIDPGAEDTLFYHAAMLAAVGENYGWDKLENYFAADDDNDYESKENYVAAAALNAVLSLDVDFGNDYLKYVNSFRKLVKLCCDGYDQKKFVTFVLDNFGMDCVENTMYALKLINE